MGIEGSDRASRRSGRNRNPAFPEDLVMFEILTRLRVKSLLRFKSVCKHWNSVISSDLDFARLHLQNQLHNYHYKNQYYHLLFEVRPNRSTLDRRVYSLNFRAALALGLVKEFEGGEVRLVGSSNGLVCFHNKPDYQLWNPATQAHHLIPLPPRIGLLLGQRNRIICQGFGYSPSFVDHKIVVVCGLQVEEPEPILVLHAFVFSWMTNRWTEKEYDLHHYYELFHHNDHLSPLMGSSEPAVQVGETLHWCLNLRNWDSHRRSLVLAFDLANESIDFVPLPSHKTRRKSPFNYVLSKISQHLCLSWYSDDAVRAWVLLQQQGEPKNSWTKFFIVVEDCDRRRKGRGHRHLGLLEVKDARSDNSSIVVVLYHDCYKLVVMEQQIQAGVRPCIAASFTHPYQHRLHRLTPVEYVPSLMSPCPPPLSQPDIHETCFCD